MCLVVSTERVAMLIFSRPAFRILLSKKKKSIKKNRKTPSKKKDRQTQKKQKRDEFWLRSFFLYLGDDDDGHDGSLEEPQELHWR